MTQHHQQRSDPTRRCGIARLSCSSLAPPALPAPITRCTPPPHEANSLGRQSVMTHANTTRKTELPVAAALLIALAYGALPAPAHAGDIPRVTVSFADLNLSNHLGAVTLYRRIEVAARGRNRQQVTACTSKPGLSGYRSMTEPTIAPLELDAKSSSGLPSHSGSVSILLSPRFLMRACRHKTLLRIRNRRAPHLSIQSGVPSADRPHPVVGSVGEASNALTGTTAASVSTRRIEPVGALIEEDGNCGLNPRIHRRQNTHLNAAARACQPGRATALARGLTSHRTARSECSTEPTRGGLSPGRAARSDEHRIAR